MKKPIIIKEFITDCYIKEGNIVHKYFKLPSTLVFSELKDEDYKIYFLYHKIEYCIKFLSMESHFFCFLNNREWFTEMEVTDLATSLGLQIVCDINFKKLIITRVMDGPNWEVIPYMSLFKINDQFILVIKQPFATYDAGADLPYIHRIAIVELSEEFKSKIGF